jgi:porin
MKRYTLRIVVHAWLIAAVAATPVLAKDPDGSTNWFAQGLEDLGINLRGSEIDQWARNPSGGVAEGDTNVGQLQFGADLDLKRLLGIDGGSFHFVIYRDYGQALNQNFTGTFTKQQYIYKNAFPQLHLGLFAYEQKLLDNRLDIQLGRLGSTTYYGHLVTNCQFMSGTTCGEPRMLVAETGLSLLPSATWGTNIKFRTTAHTYIESGIFEVNPTTAPSNGLHFSVNQATGYTVPTEFAWVNADPNTTPYPFELKAGAYVIFGGIVQQLEVAEIMRQQIYTGFVWTAPSAYRPKDSLGLSISEFELTPGERYFLRDARIKAGGTGTNAAHQIAYDLTYSVRLWRGVELMPSLQYIQHPDNSTITKTTSVPGNLFVYGIGLRMDLGYMAGFMRGGPSD